MTTGSDVEVFVAVEDRVKRGLVIVAAGDQQALHGGCSAALARIGTALPGSSEAL